jgi:hypothetical protein
MVSLRHVSAPDCHLQEIYEHKGSEVQNPTSGINRPNCHLSNIKKVKSTLEQATKTQRGSRCIALLFL